MNHIVSQETGNLYSRDGERLRQIGEIGATLQPAIDAIARALRVKVFSQCGRRARWGTIAIFFASVTRFVLK